MVNRPFGLWLQLGQRIRAAPTGASLNSRLVAMGGNTARCPCYIDSRSLLQSYAVEV